MQNPDLILYQNTSGHEAFQATSFINILHEKDKWEHDAYWKVDKALFDIAEKYQNDPMPRELILAIFDFYQYTFGRLCWHQMLSDGSFIDNLTDEACFQYSERLTYVVRGALGGQTGKNEKFEVVNPLL